LLFSGIKPEFQAWNEKVAVFLVNEAVPWCRQYAIFTDKFDQLLKEAQIGTQ
jgi:hypothetical protein